MAGQSMLMGEAFGKSFQYGKRKISSLSNEEFNKLSSHDIQVQILTDYQTLIPTMHKAIQESTKFQALIIREMGEILKTIPAELQHFFFGSEGYQGPRDASGSQFGVVTDVKGTISPNLGGFSTSFGVSKGILTALAQGHTIEEILEATGDAGLEALDELGFDMSKIIPPPKKKTVTYKKPIPLARPDVTVPVTERDTRKKQLEDYVKSLHSQIEAEEGNLRRLKGMKNSSAYQWTSADRNSAKRKTKGQQRANIDREIRRVENLIKDYKGKLAGSQQLLRNYR